MFEGILLRCNHPKRFHKQLLEGRETALAAGYSDYFCRIIADLAPEPLNDLGSIIVQRRAAELHSDDGNDLGKVKQGNAKRHLGHLWALQLSESLPWETVESKFLTSGLRKSEPTN